MFYEELDIPVDIEKLRREITDLKEELGQPVTQGEEFETAEYKGFGGWSLLSRTGDWRDGWETFQAPDGRKFESFLPTEELTLKALKYFHMCHSLEHDKPTQGYVGEIRKVLNHIKELGFHPTRARISRMKAHGKSLVHTDCEIGEYMARIHIPIWSNPDCAFIANGHHLYMQPGKVYIVWVNIWHQIRNDSDLDRYHIIMDAYDTKKITKHFKYEGDFAELQNYARAYREKIEEVELTTEDHELFEALKARYLNREEHKGLIFEV